MSAAALMRAWQPSGCERSACTIPARRPAARTLARRLFRFVPRPGIRENDVDAPRGKLPGYDDAHPFAAGDQRDFVGEFHDDKCNHENTKTRKEISAWFLSGAGRGSREARSGRQSRPCRVDDRATLLQSGCRPVLVLETDSAVGSDVDDHRVHGLDVQPHYTPGRGDARAASSTPRTSVAVGLAFRRAAVAYSTFTSASLTSRSTGASAPGAFGIDVTITSRTVT